MDRLDAMATFLAAVEAGSLSAASRALGVPLATVSRKVAELEAQLRAQLLVRTRTGLVLSEAGAAYVTAARRILDQVEEAERAASGEYRAPRGALTITAPVLFGRLYVAPVVLGFLRAYPEVNVRLVLADQVLDLIDAHADVAVRIGALPDSSLIARQLGAVCWVSCASPAYLAARGALRDPAELAGHDCIRFSILDGPQAWDYQVAGVPMRVPVQARLAVNSADTVIEAAQSGAGVARVLSYQVAAAIADGSLVQVLKGFAPPPVPVHLLHAPQPSLPLKLRAFLDFAAPRLKAALADIPRG